MKNRYVINMTEKDGVWVQDIIFSQEANKNGELFNCILFNNGTKIIFNQQLYSSGFQVQSMIECRVSYDRGKTFGDIEEWSENKFIEYMDKLKSMTAEEVGKRVQGNN